MRPDLKALVAGAESKRSGDDYLIPFTTCNAP
jgi:hypothetical protein